MAADAQRIGLSKKEGLQDFVWVAYAPDSRSACPVKAQRASSAALRPAVTGQSLRLEVVHADSGAFGQCWPQEFIVGTEGSRVRAMVQLQCVEPWQISAAVV